MKPKVSNLAAKSVSILRAAKTIVLQACDVENTSEDMSFMAAKGKSSTSATYCAAGNPNKTNCANRTGLPGVSMHYFPKDETLRQKWIRFVRIHRKDFVLKKQSALCSAHSDDSCFDIVGIPVYDENGRLIEPPKRRLIPGSVPSKDSLVPWTSPLTSRKRRKVSTRVGNSFIFLQLKVCHVQI